MKKICFLSTSAYPLFNPKSKASHGGSELQVYLIAKELAKNKENKISFIVGNFNQKKYENIDGIKLIRTFNPKNNSFSFLSKFYQALIYFYILIKENPHICFTSSATSSVAIFAFYCKIFKKKHIHRCANLYDVNMDWIKENGILGKIYKYGLENASVVLCQTEEQLVQIKKNHNIDAILFKNLFSFENQENSRKKDYILWVGRTSKVKKPELFLELAKRNPEKNFIMILNNNDEKHFSDIKKIAEKLNNFELIEKVLFEQIQKYFDEAKLFISTSDIEGFANTFIQSGIGKTPILSLNSNPDDFINKYKCGYFANSSFDDLNNYIQKLFEDKKLYDELSKNIYKYVKENYDIKNNIKVLEKLL